MYGSVNRFMYNRSNTIQMRTIKFRIWDDILKILYTPELDAEIVNLWEVPKLQGGVLKMREGIMVMQFTGLTDKNGKEIYEGDILEFRRGYNYSNNKPSFIAPVQFENGAFTIDILHSNLSKCNGDYYNWGLACGWTLGTKSIHNSNGTIEVIGNIHENPELCQ